MNIQNIHSGDHYKNYKVLCDALEETVKEGNSKKCQMKEFSRWVEFHREGNAYIIDNVHDKPLIILNGRDSVSIPEDNKNQKFNEYLENIIIRELLFDTPSLNISKSELYIKLGFVNSNFYDKNVKDEFLKNYPDIKQEEVLVVRDKAKQKASSSLKYTLENLQNKGWIFYQEEYKLRFEQRNGEGYFFDVEANNIDRIRVQEEKSNLLDDYGYYSIREVYANNKSDAFYSRLNNILIEKYGFKVVALTLNLERIMEVGNDRLSDHELKFAKEQVNNSMIAYLENNISKDYVKRSGIYPIKVVGSLKLKEKREKEFWIRDALNRLPSKTECMAHFNIIADYFINLNYE